MVVIVTGGERGRWWRASPQGKWGVSGPPKGGAIEGSLMTAVLTWCCNHQALSMSAIRYKDKDREGK